MYYIINILFYSRTPHISLYSTAIHPYKGDEEMTPMEQGPRSEEQVKSLCSPLALKGVKKFIIGN